ncbi:PQQ-binding-like beta-propeller repeat protein [Sphingomonas sp. HDW15A]|uniref:outer membrane protein assembly factor BamB family protein n=1 Tax=Sphingomonas sp. HDW15A TaxID=2714942 RepID=UPI00140930A9|nr:PQQ-binding-like beta-propeller repeat protein [Sphingomonas sp. HDW15A]QIK96618.1 PQQ-binding-like beta-propeller repeat protein [Sphingomonas sp. HDW15A]
MTLRNRNLVLIVSASALVTACNPFKKDRVETPTVGERVSVLVNEIELQVDPETAAMPMVLPEAVANEEWAQSGGNAYKSVGHVALGQALGTAWTARIGEGNHSGARLVTGPVVGGGRVYTIDTLGVVRAFDTRNGGEIWSARFGDAGKDRAVLYGGGVAFDNGRIYATNGLGYVAALDAGTGAPIWTVKPAGPLRGAPTVVGDALYVMSQDNQLFSLKTADGATNWSSAAALEIAGVFGSGAPAVARGTVVAGFSSGELNAYRYENGRVVWQDALQRTTMSTSVASLSDVDADPVIDGNQVFALGKGGRMVALELTSGQRIWEQNVGSIATPWVAGDWVFVATDEGKVLAMSRANGKIRWLTELRRWRDQAGKKGPIYYSGPVLAGGRLIVAGTNGTLINIDPATGVVQSQTGAGDGVTAQPVVAGSTLYILTEGGRLIAYR